MRIGIDISQLAYPNSGVANYLGSLVCEMIKQDRKNNYILFFSSLRGKLSDRTMKRIMEAGGERVVVKRAFFPPIFLEFVWNRLHIMPVEWLIGQVDIFITSDWTEPPSIKAKKATILYDLVVYKYPQETHEQWKFSPATMKITANIVASQKRRLKHVVKESDVIFCISEATKKDATEILQVSQERLHVMYPGLTL